MASSVLIFLSTLAFFLVATTLSLVVLDDLLSTQPPFSWLRYGFLVCSGLFCVLFFSLWKPHVVESAIEAGIRIARRKPGSWREHLARWGEGLEGSIHRYQENGLVLWREHRVSVLASSVITSIYYLNRLNLSYFLLRGLGLEVDYLTALALLALLRFALHFIPTPGGSGVGEITIGAIMSTVIPAYLLPIYAVLYRAFHLFLPATLGTWVLISELKKAGKEGVTHPPDR